MKKHFPLFPLICKHHVTDRALIILMSQIKTQVISCSLYNVTAQLFNQPITWQEHDAQYHSDLVQELQLMFTSNIKLEKSEISTTSTML